MTQAPDFEALEITFPESRDEQGRLIEGIQQARRGQRTATDTLHRDSIVSVTV